MPNRLFCYDNDPHFGNLITQDGRIVLPPATTTLTKGVLGFNRTNVYVPNLVMPAITLTTQIDAPIETVFDLSRSIDLHMESMQQTNEKAVAGCTSGLINLSEEVTWEATHFGIRQRLTTKIVEFDRPHHFRRDEERPGFFLRKVVKRIIFSCVLWHATGISLT